MRVLVGPRTEAVIPHGASKQIMLAALEAAELDLLHTLHVIPAGDRSSRLACGAWTTHDVVAHLADWDTYFLNWLKPLCGETQDELHYDNDGDCFNQWLQEQRVGQSWQRVWRDMRINRQVFVAKLASVSDRNFLKKQNTSFGTVYHVAWSALEHYLDHAAGLRRELHIAVPDELLHFHGPYTD